jgi:hypothetical protein
MKLRVRRGDTPRKPKHVLTEGAWVDIRFDVTIAPLVAGQAVALDSWPLQGRTICGIKTKQRKDRQLLQRCRIFHFPKKMKCERDGSGLDGSSLPSNYRYHPEPPIGWLGLESYGGPGYVEPAGCRPMGHAVIAGGVLDWRKHIHVHSGRRTAHRC